MQCHHIAHCVEYNIHIHMVHKLLYHSFLLYLYILCVCVCVCVHVCVSVGVSVCLCSCSFLYGSALAVTRCPESGTSSLSTEFEGF